MKVFDDAELVFDLKNIPATSNYEIVLRYEPQVSIVLQFVSIGYTQSEPKWYYLYGYV